MVFNLKSYKEIFIPFLENIYSKILILFLLLASNFSSYSTDYEYTVTANGASNYVFSSGGVDLDNPTLNVKVGDKITLFHGAGPSHPLFIVSQLSGGAYSSSFNQAGVADNGVVGGTIIWDLTGVAPGEYYYICSNHAAMQGKIIVSALTDTDSDGVPDDTDVDDDNDGITDDLEGASDLDTDGDGTPNRLDLDSDGDGCNDVVEAGYTDGDNDGIAGVAPYEYLVDGKVKNVDYKTFSALDDLDANSTKDFLEKGSVLSKNIDPTALNVLEYTNVTFVGSGATVGNFGTITFDWQISPDDGSSWDNVSKYITDNPSHPGKYSGMTNDTLKIDSVTFAMEGYRYRLYMQTPAFKCDADITTNDAKLTVFKYDFDSDGIPDETDVDDDNDGLLDTVEGEDTDTDGDGNPNSRDLDSDGDGCNDVIEAGWSDEDGNGTVGINPLQVNSSGKVTSIPTGTTAYSTPNDLDGNGTADYLEVGAAATLVSSPIDLTVSNQNSASFIVKGNSSSTISYTWQVSTDAGVSFKNIEQPKIVITGGGRGNNQNNKVFLELYALEDVPANTYQIKFKNPATNQEYSRTLSNKIDKGKYYVFGQKNTTWVDFFENINVTTTYGDKLGKYYQWTDLQYLKGNIGLKLVDMDDNIIDIYGEYGVDGESKSWNYEKGFFHRNDNNYSNKTFDFNEWQVCKGCLNTSPNSASSTPYPLMTYDVSPDNLYSGLNNDTLTINNAQLSLDRNQYRAVIKSVNYLCDNGTNSLAAELIVFLDTDKDGVGDVNDLDDDNDGIVDTDESSILDYDGDGIVNSLDLDSDGDGCNDVIEAGFGDSDNDGVLGTGTPTVDSNGKVTSTSDGYTTPKDGDANSVVDFLQPDYDAVVLTQPLDVITDEESTITLIALASTSSTYTNWYINEPNQTDSRYNAAVLHPSYTNGQWFDNWANTTNYRSVAEFNTIRNDAITGYTYLTQYDGHSYYYKTSNSNWETAVSSAIDAGGYLIVLESDEENTYVVEEWKKVLSTNVFWINYSQDHEASDYAHPLGGWNWGDIPGSVTYQWQIGSISGSDTTWTNLSNGTYYAGVTNDTLTVKTAPSTFNGNIYRAQILNASNSCQTNLVTNVSKLTVFSDPDGDGIKNSVDLDDDNDGILDTVEGDEDLDGDGIPNRIDLDSDGDGCNDVLEAGFADGDSDGILGTGTPSTGTDGKITGHSYGTPADGDASGAPDFKEKGDSPVISTDLSTTTVSAIGSSEKLTVAVNIDDILGISTYSNWKNNEPNGNSNVAQMYTSGLWDDLTSGSTRNFVVEFNSLRNDEITGYTYMTQYNGHSYYVSSSKFNHATSVSNSIIISGYLVIINDDAENTIVRNATTAAGKGDIWINYIQDTSSPKYYEPDGGWGPGGYPSTVNYNWQVSSDSVAWSTIADVSPYSGATTKELTISSTPSSLNGYQYRVIVSNPGFVCSVNDTSIVSTLVTRNDFDGDGIEDDSDLDDDNDGILDTQEGSGSTDTDGDGKPDSQDLDSDGDGCYDVDEYFGTGTDRDSNSDGIFGGENPTINANGSVSGVPSSSGLDADGNGVKDFQEAGEAISSVSCPGDITVIESIDFNIISTGSAGSTSINYQWQVSADTGTTWTNTGNSESNLIITGLGYGKASTSSNGQPKFIELYAIKDVNLAEYRIRDNRVNGPTSVYGYAMISQSGTLKAGEYMVIYQNTSITEFTSFFGKSPADLYSKAIANSYLNITLKNGNESFSMERNITGKGWTYVDRVGTGFAAGYTTKYDDGWIYRKSGSNPSTTFNENQWTTCKDCLESITNDGSSTSFPLQSFTGGYTVSQVSDTLKILDVSNSVSGYQFRVIASTPSYACGANDTSCVVTVTVLPDNDKDGVADINDLDDDNDGILDTDEGSTDKDLDGIINSSDLDSDGDGCNDVLEAGFLDGDSDGILGSAPVTVDAEGKVTSGTGYTTPKDGDSNSIPDYLEVGTSLSINTQPLNYVTEDDDTVLFIVGYTVQGPVTFQWQESKDVGASWTNLTETSTYVGVTNDTLQVNKVSSSFNGFLYRAVINTPTFACQDSIVSANGSLNVNSDFDGDGILNSVDLDDDNDGILDTDEGDLDTDNDGLINRFDLDSDGDGCFDVTEAGFTDKVLDTNADGLLGDLPVEVDSNGKVTSGVDGYTTPADADSDGVLDFLDSGSDIAIITNISSLTMISSGTGSFTITATVPSDDIIYQWQESRDNGASWFDITDAPPYAGSATKTLTLTQPSSAISGYKYRVTLTQPSFICSVASLSLEVDLIVYPDNDKDGVRDTQDQDDDNDGILDTFEGTGDLDQDGIDNVFDLDSDGDGCSDVIEAGYTDTNGDGTIGSESSLHIDSANVGSNGRVLGSGGYGTPNDLDGNGIYDFLEEGAAISAITCPDSVTVNEGGNGAFETSVTLSTGKASYQWEISADTGKSWTDVQDVKLVFVGIGQGYNSSSRGGRPQFIELYATGDIDDLSKYRVYSYPNGTSSASRVLTLSGSISKGQFLMVYYDQYYFGRYFAPQGESYSNWYPSKLYPKYFQDVIIYYDLVGGDDAFGLDIIQQDGTSTRVDAIGVIGEDGTGKAWEYSKGWMKRKDNKNPSPTFNVNDWTNCKDCLGNVSYNYLAETPYQLKTFTSENSLNGASSNKLTLRDISYSMHGNLVRAKISTPAFACDTDTVTCSAVLSVIPFDTDTDGVPDKDDVDDDNDGILDTDEGSGDIDGDGIINSLDLDSDGDGCYDVLEAGFTDDNSDGKLGGDPISIDTTGKVTSGTDGYTTPADNDANGTQDYKQLSIQVVIVTQPIDVIRQGGDNASFTVVDSTTTDPTATFQWQVSSDSVTWTNLENGGFYSGVTTKTLTLTSVEESIDGYKYRVVITSPALLCADPVISSEVSLTAKDDSDGDGIPNTNDLDSDNDGITNIREGTTDVDGDGIPNYLDLDSDGDGCYDVLEAGHSDPDNDGLLGTSPVTITEGVGLVSGAGGYVETNMDMDNNGVYDLLEAGGPITSITSPINVQTSQGIQVTFTSSGTADSPILFQWQVSSDNGDTWVNTVDGATYSGSKLSSLVISSSTTILSSNLYKAVLSTPSFVCGVNDTTVSARLIVLPDNDGDGIQDLDDQDDDNDGILDSEEFIDDLDGDGIPNLFDLDSDGDGCNDVIEAGFLDPNEDGILGDSVDTNGDGIKDVAAVVDSNGRVTSGTGYSTPNDLDENDTKDFLEKGSQAVINSDLVETNAVAEFSDLVISVDASGDGTLAYQWQVSSDACTTWSDVTESPDLMITGFLQSNNGTYENIELYAVNDIDNLSDYGIDVTNGSSSSPYEWFNDITSLKAGEYLMVYYNTNWKNYFDLSSARTYKQEYVYDLRNISSDYKNVALYKKGNPSGNILIDVYGTLGTNPNETATDFHEGWAYRKNGRGASTTFNISDWNIRDKEFDNQGTNEVSLNPYPIFKFSNPQLYKGTKTDSLTISKIPITFNNLSYRVQVSTPAFACDTLVSSSCSKITVEAMPDTDGDGVPDYVDLDSDNDGIPDIIEGCDVDTDSDGIPNCLDLDSDGDGCNDVNEAGFTDSDGDGMLGPNDIFVDVNGLVSSGTDGYTDPVDLDLTGIDDFLELGDTVTIGVNPSSVNVLLLDDTIFYGSGTAPGVISKRWQQSSDGGISFKTLTNTPDIIITGVMEANRSNQLRPKIIELKAIRDITELGLYKIKINDNQEITLNYTGGLSKGDFFYLYSNNSYGSAFLGSTLWNSLKKQLDGNVFQANGQQPVSLYQRDSISSTSWNKVDQFGLVSPKPNYDKGWMYRKDTTQVLTYYNATDWTDCQGCLGNKNTNAIAGNDSITVDGIKISKRFPIGTYGKPVIISGVNSDTLRIENIPYSMNGYKYNLEMQTPGYFCDPDVSTDVSTLNVYMPDFDNDGYIDKLDLDADNDGILNVDEDTTDIDGDGFPNYIDLDSDGDGCLDAIEAGFTDPDNDGYLGTSPVEVDSDGKVINQGGYTDANDLDANGVKDYKEKGSQATIVTQPYNQVYVDETAKIYVVANSDADLKYQWQILVDTTGSNWTDVTDSGNFSTSKTDTLNILDSASVYLPNKFRVMITTPGFACGDTLYSDPAKFVNSDDWDEDGIPDITDLDDDNDGILDISEGEDVDTDEDGIPNSKDNDSDGDGCPDAVEAGYTDPDNDGFLGNSPVDVSEVGLVKDQGGYTPPEDDIDDNGILDLLEKGSVAVVNIQPVNDTLSAGGNASFTASVSADGAYILKWQFSSNGTSWIDISSDTVIVGTDTTYYSGRTDSVLTVTNVTFAMANYAYRIVASTPSFKCGDDVPSSPAFVKLDGDNDEDGIPDIIDLDDDNDGILDSLETGGDIDGDGIPNWFDLDSDGDGCNDVEEAGMEDSDGDGILCSSPVSVDALGKVLCIKESASKEFKDSDFYKLSSASYVTSSEKSPGYYKLTNNSNTSYGSSFRNTKVDLRGDFSITADLYFGDKDENGGSGIAFNLFRDHKQYYLYYWNELGMQYKPNVSIAFDTKKGTWSTNEKDFVGLHINGLGSENNYSNSYNGRYPVKTVDLENIEDGNWHTFTFNWNAASKQLTVVFKGITVITHSIDIIKDVFDSQTSAYFGFTSDTGSDNKYNEHRAYIKEYYEIDPLGTIYKGYTTPNDLDGNGTPDYKESGGNVTFTGEYAPNTLVTVVENKDTVFVTGVNNTGNGTEVWQKSCDGGENWTTLAESSSLVISGIFKGDIGGEEPSAIELYALKNIADLSSYGIEIAREGSGTNAVEYNLAAVSLDSGKYYTIAYPGTYYKSWFSSEPDQSSFYNNFNGDDAVVLYNNNKIIDVAGNPSEDGSSKEWEYTNGWLYSKYGRSSSTTFNVNDWTTCKGCSEEYSTNAAMEKPFPTNTFSGASRYVGVDTDTLTILNANSTLDGCYFRRAVINPSFICDTLIVAEPAILAMYLDNDNDGIIDQIDLDDDNDGILDSLETETDIDTDGIKNSFDLDTDGDGCNDVIEAGFTDGDGDGILGSSPVTVDSLGRVTSGSDGYTTPADLDGSGTPDYKEVGKTPELVSSPTSITVTENGSECTSYFVTSANIIGASSGGISCTEFDKDDYILVGDAVYVPSDKSFLLTPASTGKKGMAWYKNRIDLTQNFEVNAEVNLGSNENGADGIAFVMQPLSSDQGSTGGGIGYSGISPSVAVEFDSYQYNSNDPASDHIAVTYNGVSTQHYETVNISQLEDGNYHPVKFTWNASSQILTVNYDGADIITLNKDIIKDIFSDNPYIYFGFTASTGASVNNQSVKFKSYCAIDEGDQPTTENVCYTWEVSDNSGQTWNKLVNDSIYTGVNNDTLYICPPTVDMTGKMFRALIYNCAFACTDTVTTTSAILSVLPDNDEDGIPDDIDVDDDNDGILDTKEDTTDLDGDGIPNHFDLDTDGDGCFDVIEAGFEDNDSVPDGILGNSPVVVDAEGRVIRNNDNSTSQGYSKPKDGDANITEDYREIGSAAIITTEPLNSKVSEGDTITLSTVVSVTGTAIYEWYESRDSGYVWIKLPPFAPYSGIDTETLTINAAPMSMNGYQYKLIVSTPAYACGENDTSQVSIISVNNDNDEDGIPNNIDIDDDNDGIVDTLEVIDSENDDDFDNDGIPNHFDLDSDGDGCFDVLEGGFPDPDGDGILCTSPVTVNNVGQVICGCTSSSTLSMTGDFNVSMTGGYPIALPPQNIKDSDDPAEGDGAVFEKTVNIKLDLVEGDVLEKCDLALDINNYFDDGLKFSIDGTMLLFFNQFHYDNSKGANTTEFNAGGKFDIDQNGYWSPWTKEGNPKLEISSGVIKLMVDTKDGTREDALPFMDASVTGWVLSSGFTYDCVAGFTLVFGNTNHCCSSGIDANLIVEAYVCNSSSIGEGYIDPLDSDSSGVKDFKEIAGPAATITSQPLDILAPELTDAIFVVGVSSDESLAYQWQKSTDSLSWTNLVEDTLYTGVTNDTLTLKMVPLAIDSIYFRVIVSTPTNVCADDLFSNAAQLLIVVDIDLDNDGIPNTEEGTGDADGDGILNYLDLDSDNDGIPDVVEGGDGALDTNGDGMIDENDTGFADTDEDGMADASEDTAAPDTDGDGRPDFLDIDSDNDGIFDVDEGGDGLLDTNNDGVIDLNDTGFSDTDEDGMDDDSESTNQPDTDGDGRPDYLDIDSDNDGIHDVEEGGDGALDTNNDGVIDSNDTGYSDSDSDGMDDGAETTPVPDSDGDGIVNYLDIDSDNDGIHDVEEGGDGALDTNNDGVIDANDTGFADIDEDGMDDTSEITPVIHTDGDIFGDGFPDYLDIDSDNDGIFDVNEGGDNILDTNNDGVINSSDTGFEDADLDGMDDDSEVSLETDTDGDGTPDFQDIDSDNDGVFDVVEGGDGDLDTDDDGFIGCICSNDSGYFDENNNGMNDTAELTLELDSDGDGIFNYVDIDSDDDGIYDVEEGGDGVLDTNGDGVISALDGNAVDSDGDGMVDASETTLPTNTDGDALPDYIDIDSDNDGIQDVIEGGDGALDTNGDGVINTFDLGFEDANENGMDDDAEITSVTESDADTFPDYQDIDSDNDGIHDVEEGGDGILDTNNDGVINSGDTGFEDADADGMDDDSELSNQTNSDGDSVADYIDIDSDNDGIFDVTEGGDGALDVNGDGAIDSNDVGYADSDGDGMDDDSEPTNPIDTDGDTLPNYLDIDSDDDGIEDVIEGGDGALDTNGDGVIDSLDDGYVDSNNDGMDDISQTSPVTNTDEDSLPDFVDLDSDNDGIQDVIEGGDGALDTNGDGILNSDDNFEYEDDDNNGMADAAEGNPVIDNDEDGIDDYQDLDSDNDGIYDVYEGGDGDNDTNGDGMIDSNDTGYSDSDNDGMEDDSEITNQPDTDGDETPDYNDLDSDDDGCYDVVEAGFVDPDGDGILGSGTPIINTLGEVLTDDSDGYNDPIDADGNGIVDCLDALTLTVIFNQQPQPVLDVLEGEAVIYSVDASTDGSLSPEYQWQTSVDNGGTWTNLVESELFVGTITNQLTVTYATVEGLDNTLYRVSITALGYYCATILSNEVLLEVQYNKIHIPSGFSPDNDGINDTWFIRGIGKYPNNKVEIYNRWEIKVFDKEKYDNTWNGTSNTGFSGEGDLLPETVYFYIFDPNDGVTKPITGYVYIRRNN